LVKICSFNGVTRVVLQHKSRNCKATEAETRDLKNGRKEKLTTFDKAVQVEENKKLSWFQINLDLASNQNSGFLQQQRDVLHSTDVVMGEGTTAFSTSIEKELFSE